MPQIISNTIKKNTKKEIANDSKKIKSVVDKKSTAKEIAAIPKTKFQLQCEGAITIEELRTRVYAHINSLDWAKIEKARASKDYEKWEDVKQRLNKKLGIK